MSATRRMPQPPPVLGLLRVWQAPAAFILLLAATALPLAEGGGPLPPLPAVVIALAVLVGLWPGLDGWRGDLALFLGAHGGAAVAIMLLGGAAGAAGPIALLPAVAGKAGAGYWAFVLACWLVGWLLVARLANRPAPLWPGWAARLERLAVPLLFGVWILILWQILVVAFAVPLVLLPPPSAIWTRIVGSIPILAADFRQTILKAVLFGWVVGCAAGFAVAVIADRVPFLRRGLLPIGNMASALPIIGIAPVMVMWFGFDWQSKAAVVIVMTFFPMLVNTVAGLAAADHMQRDLMRTYAAGYGQQFLKLRLPAAMPFIFNALKINSTLALIGAIVAEFFGTPVVGMGFRISTEVGRMSIDMVWAEIAMAALTGSLFYGLLALIERGVTFWHPSIRST